VSGGRVEVRRETAGRRGEAVTTISNKAALKAVGDDAVLRRRLNRRGYPASAKPRNTQR
jgi:hypothetical protein